MIILRQKDFVSASYKNNKQKREADKLRKERQIEKDKRRFEKVNITNINHKPVKNSQVENSIISSRDDTAVVRDRLGAIRPSGLIDKSCSIEDKKYVKDNVDFLNWRLQNNKIYGGKKEEDSVKDSIKELTPALSKKNIVRYGKDAGIDSLSHEYGHLKNIDNKYPNSKSYEDFTNKDILKDEHQASINAVGILKKAGASRKEIKQSKKNLRGFEKSYKLRDKIEKRGGSL